MTQIINILLILFCCFTTYIFIKDKKYINAFLPIIYIYILYKLNYYEYNNNEHMTSEEKLETIYKIGSMMNNGELELKNLTLDGNIKVIGNAENIGNSTINGNYTVNGKSLLKNQVKLKSHLLMDEKKSLCIGDNCTYLASIYSPSLVPPDGHTQYYNYNRINKGMCDARRIFKTDAGSSIIPNIDITNTSEIYRLNKNEMPS